MEDRRKKGTVRFDQHAVEWHFFGGVANLLRFGERDVSRKRDHEVDVEGAFGVRQIAGEAVQNAAEAAGTPMLFQRCQTIVPGIIAVLRRAAVDHNGELRRLGKFQLFQEYLLLDFSR